ncbi:hypothetical protein FRB94_009659 [Tulasnella sp. JGI-2019a]|nr:hypothetical protein FRB94_009659 [Tulasnella sp. JGI-2019a]
MQWVRRKTSPVVTWVTIILFVTTTANALLSILDVSNGFIKYGADPGTIGYFKDMWTPVRPLRRFGIAAVGSVADILLLWRLNIIWSGKRSVVIGPAIVLFIEISTSIVVNYCLLSPSLTTIRCFGTSLRYRDG